MCVCFFDTFLSLPKRHSCGEHKTTEMRGGDMEHEAYRTLFVLHQHGICFVRVCLSCLSFCVSVCLFVCLLAYLSVCLSICLSVRLFVFRSNGYLSVGLCVWSVCTVCLSAILHTCLLSLWTLCLSIYLSACMSVCLSGLVCSAFVWFDLVWRGLI